MDSNQSTNQPSVRQQNVYGAHQVYYPSNIQMADHTNPNTNNPNRSPGAARPYGTFSSTHTLRARNNVDFQNVYSSQGAAHYDEGRHMLYDPLDQQQHQPLQQQQQQQPQSSYLMENTGPYGFNAATMNGAMNGPNRYRQGTRRGNLPTVRPPAQLLTTFPRPS